MNIGELISVKTLTDNGEKHTPYRSDFIAAKNAPRTDVISEKLKLKIIASVVIAATINTYTQIVKYPASIFGLRIISSLSFGNKHYTTLFHLMQ